MRPYNKQTHNRILHLAVSGALLPCMLLTGCSAADTLFSNTASAGTNTFTSSEIEFSWWGNDERHLYTMNAVDLFQEMNPEINVTYRYGIWDGFEKRTRVWMESCKQADVMQINYSWLSQYSPDGDGFYDLYQLSDIIDLDSFTEDDLKFGEVNGKLNAIPIAFNTSTVYYNKDIYDAYGLDLPTTWDDFFEAAKVMQKDSIYPLGISQKQLFLFLLSYYEQSTGEHFFSTDGQLLADSEDIQYILEFYRRLVDEKVLMPLDQFSTTKFVKGETAGSVFWISDSDKFCTALESNGGTPVIGEYPTFAQGSLSGWYMKPATMYAISNITSFPEASAELLNYLVNSEEMAVLQGTEKGVPVSQKAVQALEEQDLLNGYGYQATQKMLENRSFMEIMIPVMENEDVIELFKQGADEYLYDKASLEDCAADIWLNIKTTIEKLN